MPTMGSSKEHVELLTQQRIARLRPMLERRRCTVDQFVAAFLQSLDAPPDDAGEQLSLVRRLVELFCRIDNFSSGFISWDDLTSFAAESTISRLDPSAAARSRASGPSVVFRHSTQLGVPHDPSLPLTRVTHVKWVPELQQMFVTYADSSCVFVFNHLCRLVARLHANLPPATALGVNAKTNSLRQHDSDVGSLGRRSSVREAVAVAPVDSVTWATQFRPQTASNSRISAPGSGTTRSRDPSSGRASPHQEPAPTLSPSVAAAGHAGAGVAEQSDFKAGSLEEAKLAAETRELVWARRLMSNSGPKPRGEQIRASRILANAAQSDALRRHALSSVTAPGSGGRGATTPKVGGPGGDGTASATDADACAAAAGGAGSEGPDSSSGPSSRLSRSNPLGCGDSARPSTAPANSSGRHRHPSGAAASTSCEDSAASHRKSIDAELGRRSHAALERQAYQLERSALRGVLSSHPAGLPLHAAERLRLASRADLTSAGPTVLAALGIKGGGTSLWKRMRQKLTRPGAAASAMAAAAETIAAAAALGGEDDDDEDAAAAAAAAMPGVSAVSRSGSRTEAVGGVKLQHGTAADSTASFSGRPKPREGLIQQGSSAAAAAVDAAAAAANGSPLKPPPGLSALSVAYDQGPSSKVRDFGYKLEAAPRFLHWSKRPVSRADEATAAGSLSIGVGATPAEQGNGNGGGSVGHQADLFGGASPNKYGGHGDAAAAEEAAQFLPHGPPLRGSTPSRSSSDGSSDSKGAADTPKALGSSTPSAATLALLDTGATLTSAEAHRRPAETGRPPTRIEQLAIPPGLHAEGSQLAVEYCMPVDRSHAADANKWRAIETSDVAHMLAVSSADLFITLWHTRSFEYRGVLHCLLPQETLAWSTGANLLFSAACVGPVTGWDVLAGSKLWTSSSLGYIGPVHCLLDVPLAGVVSSGGQDGIIRLWSYKLESEASNSALAGLRGRRPPRLPVLAYTLTGHTGPVMRMATNPSPLCGSRVASIGIGGELCIWDVAHAMLLARITQAASVGNGLTAVCITATQPMYAVTADSANVIRIWGFDPTETANGVHECLDVYRVPDLPSDSISELCFPAPHPHVIAGGRKLLMLCPAAQGSGELLDVSVEAGSGISGVPVGAAYSTETNSLLVGEGDGVVVFDCFTGARLRRFSLFSQLTCSLAVEASTGRHFLAGDSQGGLVMASIADGAIIARATPPHRDDVTRIIAFPEDGVLLTASWDRSLRAYGYGAHAGGAQGVMPCLRIIENAAAADISAMDASRPLGLIAAGATDGTLRLWDACSFDFVGGLEGHVSSITAVAFACPAVVPLLISADDSGFIYLWAVRGSRYNPGRLMLGLRNFGFMAGPPPPSLRVYNLDEVPLPRLHTVSKPTVVDAAAPSPESTGPALSVPPRVSAEEATGSVGRAQNGNREAAAAYGSNLASMPQPPYNHISRSSGLAAAIPGTSSPSDISESRGSEQEDGELRALMGKMAERRSRIDKFAAVTGAALLNARQIGVTIALNEVGTSNSARRHEEDPGSPLGDVSRRTGGADSPLLPAEFRSGEEGPERVHMQAAQSTSATEHTAPDAMNQARRNSSSGMPTPTAARSSHADPPKSRRSVASVASRSRQDPGPSSQRRTIAVPILSLSVLCTVADEGSGNSTSREEDENPDAALTLQLYTGDGQGMLKMWELSHVLQQMNSTPAGREMGLHVLPRSKWVTALPSYHPRTTKHRVFPVQGASNVDAEASAEVELDAEMLRRRGSAGSITRAPSMGTAASMAASGGIILGIAHPTGGGTDAQRRAAEAARTQSLVNTMRSRRLGARRASAVGAATEGKLGQETAAPPRLHATSTTHPLAVSSTSPSTKGGEAGDACSGGLRRANSRAVPSGGGGGSSKECSSSGAAGASTPLSGGLSGGRPALRPLRGKAQLFSSSALPCQPSAAAPAAPGPADVTIPGLRDAMHSSASTTALHNPCLPSSSASGAPPQKQWEELVDRHVLRPGPGGEVDLGFRHKAEDTGELQFPHVEPFLGAVLFSRFVDRHHPLPLLPVLVKPTGERVTSDPSVTAAVETGHGLAYRVPVPPASSSRTNNPMLAAIPQSVADELWYTFSTGDTDFARRKREVLDAADGVAARLNWARYIAEEAAANRADAQHNELESTDDTVAVAAVGTAGAPLRFLSGASPALRRLSIGQVPIHTMGGSTSVPSGARPMWVVPPDVWAASRLRLDIRPIYSWTAHTDVVTSISLILEPLTIVSTSSDRSVRMWRRDGLPVAVVTNIPPNTRLEQAMAAAQTALATLGGVDPDLGSAVKAAPNLTKETTPWQFVPSNAARVARQTEQASKLISRLKVHAEGKARKRRRNNPHGSAAGSGPLEGGASPSDADTRDGSSGEEEHWYQGGGYASMSKELGSIPRSQQVATALRQAAAVGGSARGSASSGTATNATLRLSEAATRFAERVFLDSDSSGNANISDGIDPTTSQHAAAGGAGIAEHGSAAVPSPPPQQRQQQKIPIDESVLRDAAKALDAALIQAIESWDTDEPHAAAALRRASIIAGLAPERFAQLIGADIGEGAVEQESKKAGRAGGPNRKAAAPLGAALDGKGATAAAHSTRNIVRHTGAAGITLAVDVSRSTAATGGSTPGVEPDVPQSQRMSISSAGSHAVISAVGTAVGEGLPTGSQLSEPASRLPEEHRDAAAAGGLERSSCDVAASSPSAPSQHARSTMLAASIDARYEHLVTEQAGRHQPGSIERSADNALAAAARVMLPARMLRRLRVSDPAGVLADSPVVAAPQRPAILQRRPATAAAPPAAARSVRAFEDGARASQPGCRVAAVPPSPTPLTPARPRTAKGMSTNPKLPVAAASPLVRRSSAAAVSPLNLSRAQISPQGASLDFGGHIASAEGGDVSESAREANLVLSVLQTDVSSEWQLDAASPQQHRAALEACSNELQTVQPTQSPSGAVTAAGDAAPPFGFAAHSAVRPSTAAAAWALASALGPEWQAARTATASAGPSTSSTTPGRRSLQLPEPSRGRVRQPDIAPLTVEAGSPLALAASDDDDRDRTVLSIAEFDACLGRPSRGTPSAAAHDLAPHHGRLPHAPPSTHPRAKSATPQSRHSAAHPPAATPTTTAPTRELHFGQYTTAQVEAFRKLWKTLDKDGSGAVDVEEMMNSNFFSAATLKVTKAVFSSIDEDASGDVSQAELLKVTFPLSDSHIRADMLKYIRALDAKDAQTRDEEEELRGRKEEEIRRRARGL